MTIHGETETAGNYFGSGAHIKIRTAYSKNTKRES